MKITEQAKVIGLLIGIIAAYTASTISCIYIQNKLLKNIQKMEMIMVDAKIATYENDGKFVVLWKGVENEQ